jgi:hypothetical protein
MRMRRKGTAAPGETDVRGRSPPDAPDLRRQLGPEDTKKSRTDSLYHLSHGQREPAG